MNVLSKVFWGRASNAYWASAAARPVPFEAHVITGDFVISKPVHSGGLSL